MKEENLQYDMIIEQGILYNFVHFDVPRLVTYDYPTNVYELSKGWLTEPRTVLVIGEDDSSYITELILSERIEWTDKRVLYKYILPLGFHKSRLIKWEDTQLSMF